MWLLYFFPGEKGHFDSAQETQAALHHNRRAKSHTWQMSRPTPCGAWMPASFFRAYWETSEEVMDASAICSRYFALAGMGGGPLPRQKHNDHTLPKLSGLQPRFLIAGEVVDLQSCIYMQWKLR